LRTVERNILILNEEGDVLWSDFGSRSLFPSPNGNGPNFFELLHEETRPSIERAMLAAIDRGRDEELKTHILTPLGEDTEVTLCFVPLQGEGDLTSVIMTRPITDRSPAFLDLQQFVLNLDRAMDRIDSPVISADGLGRILMLNQEAEELTGFMTKEVMGQEFISLFGVEGTVREEIEGIIEEVLGGAVRNFQAPLRTKHGDQVERSWRLTFAELGEEEGILMAFDYDPLSIPPKSGLSEDIDENLLLLISGSSHLLGTADPSVSVDEELERLIDAQSLHFGILRVDGLENGTMTFSAGIHRNGVDAVLASPTIDLDALSSNDSPTIIELDPWAYRAKMPQEVNSLFHIPLASGGSIKGFALFGTEGSVRRWSSRKPILHIFSNQVLASLRNSEMIAALARKTMEVHSLYEVSQIFSSTLDLETLLDEVVEKGKVLVKADRCDIYGLEDGSGSIKLLKSHMDGVSTTPGHLYEGMISKVLNSGRGVLSLEPSDPGSEGTGTSLMGLPLIMAREVSGVMVLERKGHQFGERELEAMELFATTTAMALRNANLYERISKIATELKAYNDLLAHDIANFNVPIHGYLEMLLSEPTLSDKQKGYVAKALKQSENITSLISNVRKLTEIRLGEDHVDPSPLDLIGVIDDVVAILSQNSQCHGVPIHFDDHPDEAIAMVSEDVKDIFTNLLKNACQFGKGGEVRIQVGPHSEGGVSYWRVDFIDRGEGVPDDWKQRIFTRFWEMDFDRRAEAKGLGLSVTQALCMKYGGRVEVSDRVEGDPSSGSVFFVLLPGVKGLDR